MHPLDFAQALVLHFNKAAGSRLFTRSSVFCWKQKT